MEKSKLRDRASILPVELRQHILSFLSTSDAIRTSQLSSHWRYDWIHLPFFDFGREFWWNNTSYLKKSKLIKERFNLILSYAQFLDRFLLVLKRQKHDEPLKLRIYLPSYVQFDETDLSMDLAFTTGDEIQLLSDYYIRDHLIRCYLFNLSGYLRGSSKFLTKLKLNGILWGKMLNTASRESISNQYQYQFEFPSLRKLSLCSICLYQRVVDNLLDGCSSTVLEVLKFENCAGFKLLQLSRFSKLKVLKVVVEKLYRVEMSNATDLHALTIGTKLQSCLVDVTSYRNLEKLSLFKCRVTNSFFNQGFANLARLKSLKLSECHELTHIEVASNSLNDLVIIDCKRLLRVEIDTPNLDSFSYYNLQSSKFMSLFPRTPIAPSCTILELIPHGLTTTNLYSEIVKLLAKPFSKVTLGLECKGGFNLSSRLERKIKSSTLESPTLMHKTN